MTSKTRLHSPKEHSRPLTLQSKRVEPEREPKYEPVHELEHKPKLKSNPKQESSTADFSCNHCAKIFSTAQALGGHMSRKHSGKSSSYNYKQDVRKKREFERARLHLAKQRFFAGLNIDYTELASSPQGKTTVKNLLNRAKIKRIKKTITEEDVASFMAIS